MKHLFVFQWHFFEESFTIFGHLDYQKNWVDWVRIYTILCLVQISRCLNYALPSSTINCHRQSWDISNFIGRDQKVAPYHLVFWGNDTKKSFLTNWGWGNNTQGVHEHSKFCKNVTVCWVRLLTMNKYSLWIVRVNKRFKKHFCGTHPF